MNATQTSASGHHHSAEFAAIRSAGRPGPQHVNMLRPPERNTGTPVRCEAAAGRDVPRSDKRDWGTEDRFARWLTHNKLSAIAGAAAIAFSAFPGFAQQALSSTLRSAATEGGQPVKNIVLVQGAFADASSWSKVIRILQVKGYNVTTVQNPLTSFVDDVTQTYANSKYYENTN